MSSLQKSAADPRCVTKLRSSRPESTTHAPCHFIVVFGRDLLVSIIVSVCTSRCFVGNSCRLFVFRLSLALHAPLLLRPPPVPAGPLAGGYLTILDSNTEDTETRKPRLHNEEIEKTTAMEPKRCCGPGVQDFMGDTGMIR